MKYKVEFQYKGPDDARPQDYVQEETIESESGEFIPIPDVGDSVSVNLGLGGKQENFLVITRHFSYLMDWCVVNIVVTDIPSEDMAARLKM